MSLDDFKSLYATSSKVFVKPIDGTEGKDIRVIDCVDANNQRITEIYHSLLNDNCIIEEAIIQHHLMRFNTKAVNTIRVLSVMDKNTNEVTIFKTVIRIGNENAFVDNYHKGGYVYEIDVDSGLICSPGVSTNGNVKIFHPGTNTCMLGYKIPNWNMVLDKCKKAHTLLPSCRYIAWDIAILNEGVEFIEGNHRGDYDMIEFVGNGKWWPFLKQYL